MIHVIKGQEAFVKKCPQCLCTISYLFSDTEMRRSKRKINDRLAFAAIRAVTCPICGGDINHFKD